MFPTEPIEIAGEIITILAGIVLIISFFFKSKSMMCLFNGSANAMFVLGLSLIGAWSGVVWSATLFILGITNFFVFGRKDKAVPWWFWAPFAAVGIGISIWLYGTWFDLLPMFAALLTLFVYPIPPRLTWLVRFFFLASGILWLTWGCLIMSIGAIAANGAVVFANICLFIYYEIIKKQKEKTAAVPVAAKKSENTEKE